MTENQKKAIIQLNMLLWKEEISEDEYFLLLSFVVEEKETKYVPIPEVTTPYPTVTYTANSFGTSEARKESDKVVRRRRGSNDDIFIALPDKFTSDQLLTAAFLRRERVTRSQTAQMIKNWKNRGKLTRIGRSY